MVSRSYYFLFTVLGLGLLMGFLYWKSTPKFGLDVQGGIQLTYQIVPIKRPDSTVASPEDLMAKTEQIVQNRIATTGVAEGTVAAKGEDQIIVELPGYTNIDQALQQIGSSASLKCYWANTVRRSGGEYNDAYRQYSSEEDSSESSGNPSVDFVDEQHNHQVLKPGDPEYVQMINGGTVTVYTFASDGSRPDPKIALASATSTVNATLQTADPNSRSFALARDPNQIVVYLPPTSNADTVGQAVLSSKTPGKLVQTSTVTKSADQGWKLIWSGEDLASAGSHMVGNGEYQPDITLTGAGGDKMHEWSLAHKDQQEPMALVLDNTVIEVSAVEKGEVLSSRFQIERGGNGGFPPTYVNGLVDLLNAGALPADLKLLSSEKVDPTIGKNALTKMIGAGVAAFAVIGLFLIIYYSVPGVVALVALGLYVLFTLTVLKLMGATFSLAAIAGFVLSVGMAVDANILVFERFKEEIKRGRPLHQALDLGFKRALPAIVDSNLCSILAAAVLVYLGTGPVRGFATTLIIGVSISLFTAVTVTRSLLFFVTDSGLGNNEKLYGLGKSWFGEHLEGDANTNPLHIVENTKKWFIITGTVLALGFICMGMHGLKPGVEFTGGYEAVYERTVGFPSASEINANLAKNGVKGSNVKFGTGADNVQLAYITVPGSQLAGKPRAEQSAFLTESAGLPTGTEAKSVSDVGPVIQKETTQNAIVGVLTSFLCIVIYLGFRFGLALGSFGNGIRFGVSAILAGIKDIFVIGGVAAAFGLWKGWELGALSITAMLTVIGFSVHDKIVIFDRIRENLRRPLPGETFDNLVNRSITQSFARSINTAAAVIVTLGILIAFGTTTPDLSFFCVLMLAGIAWGTYSSIYTAAPVLAIWEHYVLKHKGEGATLIGVAFADAAKKKVLRTTVAPAAAPAASQTAAPKPGDQPQRSYGQVRRRASAVDRSHHELDDDE